MSSADDKNGPLIGVLALQGAFADNINNVLPPLVVDQFRFEHPKIWNIWMGLYYRVENPPPWV
ncbi:hypothetical protein ACA910_012057 [Epithemia clementina (nom. ined.)]